MERGGFDWSLVSSSVPNLASLALNMLIDARGVDFAAEIGAIASKAGQKPGSCKAVVKEMLIVFQAAMKEGMSAKKVQDQFVSRLEMPESLAASIAALWEDADGRISSSLLAKTLKAKRLVDLDWNFGVTSSTSEMDQVGTAFLQLKMTLDVGDGNTQDEFMELSVDQFFSFLSSMEQCKKYLDLVNSIED